MANFIREAAAAGALIGSRQEITIITPGWGTSGYYSPTMLEQAAKDLVFPAETQMHIDHDSEMQQYEHPAGSLTRLAAVLEEDARWEPEWVDPKTGVKGRLVAPAKVFPPWRETLAEMAEYIGTSIAAAATFTMGEAEGRKGKIVEALHPNILNRVDYVTVAGRGGRVSAVLESALTRRITEATANETCELLRAALRAAYGGEEVWLWLRDYDGTTAWYEQEDVDGSRIYEQAYTLTNDGAVTLAADRTEVRATTHYVPVTPTIPPASPAGVTTNQEEANMATIDDAELTQLRENAGRVSALEAELATERDKNAKSEHAATEAKATAIVAEAFGDIEAKATRKALITAALAAETFNPEALADEAKEAAAEHAVAAGAGKVHGVGSPAATESKTITDGDIVSILEGGK